jgi:hypothetical protein
MMPLHKFLVIIGLGIAGFSVSGGTLTAIPLIGDVFGRAEYATGLGVCTTVWSAINSVTVFGTGYLYQITNSYFIVLYIYAVLSALVLWFFMSERNIVYIDKRNGVK